MLYFIPSWYNNDSWSENEQSWHVNRTHTEFDDTVKQIQLFHRSGVYPYHIFLLSYAPNFRHFLHRQSVYHAPYWSCFDAIQEIRSKKVALLSFHNLNWPKDIEYVYSPFVVLAMQEGRKFAQIEFGEDGNMIRIDMYRGGRLYRRNIYDDRGFVSSTILYDNEKEVYCDYLMENGVRKLRVFADGHVEINPECPTYILQYRENTFTKEFQKAVYVSLEEVIAEVVKEYVDYITFSSDLFCVAMHKRHTSILVDILKERRTVLSFFENRYTIEREPELLSMLRDTNYVITDSKENTKNIISVYRDIKEKITDISPYDSRVDFGISSQLPVQKILLPFDDLKENLFAKIIREMAKYLLINSNAQVHLFTRRADMENKEQILEKTRQILEEAGFDPEWAREEVQLEAGENRLYDDTTETRFFVEQCVDELEVSRCMREQRIIVDMREVPELYLQIAAISMGIPQIVMGVTQFIEDGKNGRVISSMPELYQSLEFYLDGLYNWNEAVVASYELGKKFSTSALISKWKEVIKLVE